MTHPRMPKYIQIKENLADLIRSEQLLPGQQIPSITEIMKQFKVSKVTAVRAIAELETEGIVDRQHGRGTFVNEHKRRPRQTSRRESVFIIVPDMTNPFYSEVVGHLEKHVREQGIAVELAGTNCEPEIEQRLITRVLADEQVTGIVLISVGTQGRGDPGLQNLSPQIPLVVVDNCPPELEGKCVSITCDNYTGGHIAAVHLASLGHRRIGYLNVPYGSQLRLQGFQKGLQEHGIEFQEDWLLTLESAWHIEAKVLAFVKRIKPSALACVNDLIAMQAMKALRSEGYRIPQDISLVGYDNVEAARFLEVPLTTVEQYEEQIGRKAAECLLEGIRARNHRLRPREIIIIPNLVIRASTAGVAE